MIGGVYVGYNILQWWKPHPQSHMWILCSVRSHAITQLHIHGKFIYYIAGIKQKQKGGEKRGS